MITGTQEQENIWRAIAETDEHIFVKAGAGTGKTFTIVEAANRLPFGNTAAFLAFNNEVAKQLSNRLPSDVEAKTFHAFGFAAIRSAGIKTRVNKFKLNNIIKDLLGKDYHVSPLKKLVGLVKGCLVNGTDKHAILDLIEEYNINFNSERELKIALESIPAILTMCRTQTFHIDFDDMIWMPLENNYPLPHYDVMFVDEAQDFNEAQREMIKRCVNGGRCIIVGDKNQAIYGFRGADSNSIGLFYENLSKGEREISEFPLSISWRCPNHVVKEANRFVKDFHAHKDAIDGTVIENARFNPQPNDMVLCRYNAPLISAFYDLIMQGKSAYILGRDMTTGLIMAIDKITRNDEMGVDEFWDMFMIDFNANFNALIKQNKKAQAIALEDKKDCIHIFVSKAENVAGIKLQIKRLFENSEKGDIMLSTVHKAKGLEADNVYILATERMPHPMGGHEENNIAYVAITRAKKNLFYVGPKPELN